MNYITSNIMTIMENEKEFLNELSELDSGRFAALFSAMSGINNSCRICYHFNPMIDDPRKGYMCKVLGRCPAATLHPNMQSYLWELLTKQ